MLFQVDIDRYNAEKSWSLIESYFSRGGIHTAFTLTRKFTENTRSDFLT